MKKIIRYFPLLLLVGLSACTSRKDRLAADTLTITIDPSTAQTVSTGGTLALKAVCRSAKSDNVDISPKWSVENNLGSFSPASGKSTTFTAGTTNGSGKIYATYQNIRGSVDLTVGSGGNSGPTILAIYSDAGLPADGSHVPDILKWGPGNTGLAEQTGGGAVGDAAKYMRDASGAETSVGWGVTLDKNDATYKRDMSSFASGHIKFFLKTNRALAGAEVVFINVEEASGTKSPNLVINSTYGWDSSNPGWQEVSVPVSAVSGISLANVHLPFEITIANITSPITMDVDNVRWTSN